MIGINDASQGTELPLAYVVLQNASDAQKSRMEGQLQAWVAERVSNHKRLRGGVRFIDEVPKSASGKILRRILRDRAKNEVPVRQRQAKL